METSLERLRQLTLLPLPTHDLGAEGEETSPLLTPTFIFRSSIVPNGDLLPKKLHIESTVETHHFSTAVTTPVMRGDVFTKIDISFREIVENVGTGSLSLNRAELMIAEIVSKVLAYEYIPGKIVKIPVNINGLLEFRDFKSVIVDLVDGNQAYYFRPQIKDDQVSPILAFRGTDPVFFSGSLVSDLGFSSITSHMLSGHVLPAIDVGRSVIRNERLSISNLLEEGYTDYGKWVLMGHSLGGKLANSFAIDGNNARFIKKVTSFNSPGITRDEVSKYQNLPDSCRFESLAIHVKGDLVGNGAGFKRFFSQKVLIDPKTVSGKPFTLADRHSKCVLSLESTVVKTQAKRKAPILFKRLLRFGYIIGPALITALLVVGLMVRIGYLIIATLVTLIHLTGVKDCFCKHRKMIDYNMSSSQFTTSRYTTQTDYYEKRTDAHIRSPRIAQA